MSAQFPEKLDFLFDPHRYKVAYGGRGAAKSWGFARALLILGTQRSLRILCARETQKSIADSVHKLLCDQIVELGLERIYKPLKASIVGVTRTPTGFIHTTIIFAGLKHNVNNIKSVEACDIVWVEEAQSVSKGSWEVLIPTIRKEGSEIWASFNPDLESDDTYQRFVVKPPAAAKVVRINHTDNPWFPAVLKAEADHLKEKDSAAYEHVWEGACINTAEGAIYANEMRAADKENRITRVPYDPSKPVHTFWDLGYGDSTSIWLAQAFPFEFRLIDFIEGARLSLKDYLKMLQERPYLYGTDYLPWDGAAKSLGSGRSIEELMREAGRRVEIVTRLSVADGIAAVRSIFPQCYFDAEKCADGIQALRHYKYGEIKTLGAPTREPLHDANSHAADAFRSFGVGIRRPERPRPPSPARNRETSWMA